MIFGNNQMSSETLKMNMAKPVFLADMCRVCMMTSEYLKEVISYELSPKIVNMLNTFADINVSMNDCLPSLICNTCYTRLRESLNFKNICIESNNTFKNYMEKLQESAYKDTPIVLSLEENGEQEKPISEKPMQVLTDNIIPSHSNSNSVNNKDYNGTVESDSMMIRQETNNIEENKDVIGETPSLKRKRQKIKKIFSSVLPDEIIVLEPPPCKRGRKNPFAFDFFNNSKENQSSNINEMCKETIIEQESELLQVPNNSDDVIIININTASENQESRVTTIEILDNDKENNNKNIETATVELINVDTYTVDHLPIDIKDSPPYSEEEIKTMPISFVEIKEPPFDEIIEPSPALLDALGLVKIKRTDSTDYKTLSSDISNPIALIKKGDNVSTSKFQSNNSTVSKSDRSSNNNNDYDIKPNIKKERKKDFLCKICNHVLFDYGTYRRHLASHGELPFPCKICDKKFKGARTLREHTITEHSGGCPYSCSQCEVKFRALEEFTAHLRRHAGSSEPHICQYCPRRFSSARKLREHTNIHDLERKPSEKYKRTPSGTGNFLCSVCSRRFRKRCDLERHERVHSGEKPYQCLICNNKFQQAHNLTKHMVTHTGMRSYTCDICNKTFGRSDVLARHMHVHEVSKPFSCKTCSRTFARQTQLQTHLERYHHEAEPTVVPLSPTY